MVRTIMKEPSLTVRPRPAPFFLRRRFLRSFLPAALPAIVGLFSLLVSGNVLLPVTPVTTVEAAMGSKRDFFEDGGVKKTLMKNNIEVQITAMGSREINDPNLEKNTMWPSFPGSQPPTRSNMD